MKTPKDKLGSLRKTAENIIDLAGRGLCDTGMAVKLKRRCKGRKARVLPGCSGYVVQRGNGKRSPSIVMVDARALLRALDAAMREASDV